MQRPDVIYLDTPYFIGSVEIRHTLPGLLYLVDHYETILAKYPHKLDAKAKQHIEETILVNYKLRIKLLEKWTNQSQP